jgi:hypothetical protein
MPEGLRLRAVTDERGRKIGANEAIFREVNERIEELAETFGLGGRPLELICECGDASCTQQISMTIGEYEALRKDPTLFAVFPGHEVPDVEDVVERRGAYDVVRKQEGEPARVARETHTRD